MTTVAEANTILLIVALLLGLAIGWWMFKAWRRSTSRATEAEVRPQVEAPRPAPPSPPARPVESSRSMAPGIDGPEGNGLVSQTAAATTDVTGELLGVRVHDELPGAGGPPDRLETMKGVGPKFVAKLNENGITRFDQLASLNSNEVELLDSRMGAFKGRLARDRVIEQTSYLARGDRDGFEAKFGKLGGA